MIERRGTFTVRPLLQSDGRSRGAIPVSAQVLIGLFDAIYAVALLAWMGGMIASLVGVLHPRSSRSADAQERQADWTPLCRLHVWGAIAGAVALPAFVAVPLSYPEFRGPRIAVQSMVILGGILVMLYVANLPTPADRLRRRIACLDVLMLLVGCGLLAVFVVRPAPRTHGLAELSPDARARYDEELGRVIEELEIKYGFREAEARSAADRGRADHLVEEATIRELDAYYREKRRRDLERSRGRPEAVAPAGPRGSTIQPDGT